MKNGLWGVHKVLQRLRCSECQAASLDGFPSEVLSRGTVGSCQQTARKVALTDEWFILANATQNTVLPWAGVREGKDAEIQCTHFTVLPFAWLWCSPQLFGTYAWSFIFTDQFFCFLLYYTKLQWQRHNPGFVTGNLGNARDFLGRSCFEWSHWEWKIVY